MVRGSARERHHLRCGPAERAGQPCSTVLSAGAEPAIIACRMHTLLPLDDCLFLAAARAAAPDAFFAAPLPPAPRHLAPAGDRGRPADQETVRELSHRLLPCRHRGRADSRRHARALHGRRPDAQVRAHRSPSQSLQGDSRAVPAPCDRSSAPCAAYGAHRQRHPIHRPEFRPVCLPMYLRAGLR